MKRTQSKPQDSHFPMRLALPPAPKWRRRPPTPDPSRGRPEDVRVELRLVREADGSAGLD